MVLPCSAISFGVPVKTISPPAERVEDSRSMDRYGKPISIIRGRVAVRPSTMVRALGSSLFGPVFCKGRAVPPCSILQAPGFFRKADYAVECVCFIGIKIVYNAFPHFPAPKCLLVHLARYVEVTTVLSDDRMYQIAGKRRA